MATGSTARINNPPLIPSRSDPKATAATAAIVQMPIQYRMGRSVVSTVCFNLSRWMYATGRAVAEADKAPAVDPNFKLERCRDFTGDYCGGG